MTDQSVAVPIALSVLAWDAAICRVLREMGAYEALGLTTKAQLDDMKALARSYFHENCQMVRALNGENK